MRIFSGDGLFDAKGDFENMPSWGEVADDMFEAGLTVNPSELHGAIVGLLGSGVVLDEDGFLPSIERVLGIELHGELVEQADTVAKASRSAMLDADYAFYPLLPGDDDDFEQRMLSLRAWATGFLSGFTQGIAVRDAGNQALTGDTAEVVKDIAAIAQVDVAETESDDSERDFEEIVEYMRVAVMSVVQAALFEQGEAE